MLGPPPQSPVALMTLFLTLNTPLSSPDGDNFHCGPESPPIARQQEFCCKRESPLPLPNGVASSPPLPLPGGDDFVVDTEFPLAIVQRQ